MRTAVELVLLFELVVLLVITYQGHDPPNIDISIAPSFLESRAEIRLEK